MYRLGRTDMARKNTYLVILGTHVDEVLAIVRIIRSRTRRKLAESELELMRHRKMIGRAIRDRHERVREFLGRMKIRRKP
jgi:hypothetical protein